MWYLWWLSQRHIRRNTSIDSKVKGTQWRLLLLGSYLLHSLFCEIMWFFPHFSYHQTQQDWTNRIDAVFSTGWFEPLWLPPCRQVSKTGWFEPLRLPPCRQVSKIICAVSCRSYCQKVLKAQVPFVFAQQKNLFSDWRSSRKQQKKVGEGNGTNGGKRTEGVSGIENVRRPWDPMGAPKSRAIFRVFFVNPSKIPGNIFKCYVYSTWRCAFICVADATPGGGVVSVLQTWFVLCFFCGSWWCVFNPKCQLVGCLKGKKLISKWYHCINSITFLEVCQVLERYPLMTWCLSCYYSLER